jgi:hypothetical protein
MEGRLKALNWREVGDMEEILYCCVCEKRITNMRGKKKVTKYPTCGDPDCIKAVRNMRVKDGQEAKRLRITKNRLAGIEKMKAELDTKEKFLKVSYGREGIRKLGRDYGVLDSDIREYKEELFADMTPSEIRALRKKVVDQIVSGFVRQKPEVKVFKIVDKAKFEAGSMGTYEGLVFDRIEYGKEFEMPFNAGFGEIERDIYVER